MDRTIVIAGFAPVPQGHRIEVVERTDESGVVSVVTVTDLESRIRYQHGGGAAWELSTWVARVLECTITTVRGSTSTALLVDPFGPGSAESEAALRGADAAADAATSEALRWGGADRMPAPEPPRFW